MDLDSLIVLFEIFFPVLGVVLIVILARMHTGKRRWAVLIFGPAILLALQFLFIKFNWIDGNLLTVTIFGLLIMAGYYYYIILIIFGLAKGWKHWKENRPSH
jgi:hypothetical protein